MNSEGYSIQQMGGGGGGGGHNVGEWGPQARCRDENMEKSFL